jgi:hypothetical protein
MNLSGRGSGWEGQFFIGPVLLQMKNAFVPVSLA